MDEATTFEPHLGTAFLVGAGDDEVALDLVEVRRLSRQPGAPREVPFTLLFLGPDEVVLPQGTHRLRHDLLGAREVFLVPIGPDPQGRQRYEAVFN